MNIKEKAEKDALTKISPFYANFHDIVLIKWYNVISTKYLVNLHPRILILLISCPKYMAVLPIRCHILLLLCEIFLLLWSNYLSGALSMRQSYRPDATCRRIPVNAALSLCVSSTSSKAASLAPDPSVVVVSTKMSSRPRFVKTRHRTVHRTGKLCVHPTGSGQARTAGNTAPSVVSSLRLTGHWFVLGWCEV